MRKVFHAKAYGRFIEAKSRRKKIQKNTKAPIFLEAILALETI